MPTSVVNRSRAAPSAMPDSEPRESEGWAARRAGAAGSVEYSPVPSTAAAMQSSLVGHETLPTGGLATRPETAT
jgi:hypothetical protein